MTRYDITYTTERSGEIMRTSVEIEDSPTLKLQLVEAVIAADNPDERQEIGEVIDQVGETDGLIDYLALMAQWDILSLEYSCDGGPITDLFPTEE